MNTYVACVERCSKLPLFSFIKGDEGEIGQQLVLITSDRIFLDTIHWAVETEPYTLNGQVGGGGQLPSQVFAWLIHPIVTWGA